MALVMLAAALAGCAIRSPFESGVDLYHDLEGGVIAQQRPPPPGADAPYPNLGTVPTRPGAPDVASQQRIADRLAAQRDAAVAAAAASPLHVLTPPPAPPKPTAPAPDDNRVVVDAAATPAAPPAPPAAAPAVAVTPVVDSVPAVPAAVTSGPLPSLAAAPPPLPVGLGVDILSAPPGAVAQVPAVLPALGNAVAVAFTPGSATLPPSAPLSLRRFALAHKGSAVTVLGKGEAVLPGADAQARALDLGLRRAQAIAGSLAEAGVAVGNLHLRAQAAGQGGSASL